MKNGWGQWGTASSAALLMAGFGMAVDYVTRGKLPRQGVGIIAVYFILFAVLLLAGTGLRRLKKWARIPTGILATLGLLAFPVGTIINAYVLYLIFSEKGSMVFSPEYQEIMAATPHIKYKTSILVWVLLGLVLLLSALGLGAALFSKH